MPHQDSAAPRPSEQHPDRSRQGGYDSYYRQSLLQLGQSNADRNVRRNATRPYYIEPHLGLFH